MERLVRVPAQGASNVFPTMTELIAPIASDLVRFRWSIFELDPWLSRTPCDQGAFIGQVEAGVSGLEVSFEVLRQFADSAVQIVDGLFLGVEETRAFPARGAGDATIISQVDVLFSAFDSSCWIVGGPEPLLRRLESNFRTDNGAGPLRS